MQLLNHRFGDDGMFWISYKDFLRKYQSLDRTRLFGPEWQITQQWTTVDVPWSADYNEIKFRVTVTEPGPVVIVLSQLDSRYFKGLEGQYTFNLHFRLEKDDDESCVVRSHSNYSMSRSVSADVRLDPGTYSVLMKVTAKRWIDDVTPDQVIRNSCMQRPEKLIQVGLSYDLAHAKGQIRETEKEKAAREKREQKKKSEDHKKRRAELRAEMLKGWETGKKRLARRKRQDKRKEEYFKRKAEKAKAAGAGQVETLENGTEPSPSDTKASESQTSQAGSEPENIQMPATEDGAPLTPPAEIITHDADEKATRDDDEDTKAGKNEQVKQEEVKGDPTDATNEQGEGKMAAVEDGEEPAPAPADETEPKEADEMAPEDGDEDEDWEHASDASFQSSIVTELDLAPLRSGTPDTSPVDDSEPDPANLEFEDDPWNAVCVVGLKVYSKDKGLCVEIVRPKHELDEADTPLDVDDVSKGQTIEKVDDTIAEEDERTKENN